MTPRPWRSSGRPTLERLLQDAGIVRNRLKVESAVSNARCVLEVQEAEGSLAEYLWSFVGGKPIVGKFRELRDMPAETAESRAMSKDLKRRGFRFVGPTSCYAFMQSTGMVIRPRHVVLPLQGARYEGLAPPGRMPRTPGLMPVSSAASGSEPNVNA